MDAHDLDGFNVLDSAEQTPDSFAPGDQPLLPTESAENDSDRIAAPGKNSTAAGRDATVTTYTASTIYFGDGADVLGRANARPRQHRGLQDPAALARRAERYVVPPGLLAADDRDGASALAILREQRVVVLVGQNDEGGQFSAGLRLGYEMRRKHPGLDVREDLFEPEVGLDATELLDRESPAVVLIDGRSAAADDLRELRRQLVAFTGKLDDYQSYLILVVAWWQRDEIANILPADAVHELGKPSSVDVLDLYLTGVDVRHLVAETGVTEELETLWPPRVEQIADAVKRRLDQDEQPRTALLNALRDLSGESDEALRKEIRTRQDADDAEGLALLLATALLEGADVSRLVTTADLLLARNGLEREPSAPLLRASPKIRFQRAAGFYHDPEAATFRSSTFGDLVLRHVWHEHPDLRAELRHWIGEIPRKFEDLKAPELDRLADRSLELAAAGGAHLATALAREWSRTTGTGSRGGDAYRRSVAVRLLAGAALHPAIGREVRDTLYRWSRRADTDVQLLTAEVCAQIGRSFPRIAFTRLKYLAGSADDTVRDTVREALVGLGRELGFTTFLRSVREWFEGDTPERLGVLAEGVAGLLRTAAPKVEPEAAVSFWRRAFDTMQPPYLRTAVQAWLHAAQRCPDRTESDELIEHLVRATNSESVRIARVHYASRVRWATPVPESPDADHTTMVDQLVTRLDEVDPIWGREDP
ncbi:hypothetical protein [Saccharomonospora saliphila]|uniref:hypothetical protein n=1 Tax=Saccharomonospora saliphila TaxID=369829 RepID=UPI000366C13B|nr:hypothetical protein [Saccharomonospora saliphila]